MTIASMGVATQRKRNTLIMSKCDLRLSAKKLGFKSSSVTFMRQKLTDKGEKPDPAKVTTITGMLTPTDKAGVQRSLECANI